MNKQTKVRLMRVSSHIIEKVGQGNRKRGWRRIKKNYSALSWRDKTKILADTEYLTY